jgi:hypothetical protein
MRKSTKSFIIALIVSLRIFSQEPQKTENQPSGAFPEIKGYVGIVHPIYTWSKEGNTANFKYYYTVGNPWGINIWKSKKVGVSFEFTPFIRSDVRGSRVSNFLFHPGILYRLKYDFMLIGRAAYETAGRYGVTPILNKVLIRYPKSNVFVAALLPIRFENNHAPSYTVAFQFGIGF